MFAAAVIFACAVFCINASCAELTECTFEASEGKEQRLQDSNHKTKVTFEEGGTVRVSVPENGEKISFLYVIWDTPVGVWYLNEEHVTYTQGKNDFIHEFIALHNECSYIIINVPKGGVLCDVRVFSEGDIPNDVQIWSPPCDRADLLMLPTHSDDDHLYFGGTMPYYGGELGMNVQVAYITNHWGEPVRTHELLNGLWTVGITNYPVISEFKDKYTMSLESAQKIYDSDEMRGYIVELIRRFKPYVLLGHDLKGEYGHGAHMLSALLITEAVEISMDKTQYPESAEKYGVWDVPKTYLHNYEENQICIDWDIPLEKFDGKTGFEMAKVGFACHVSQHKFELAVIRNGRCSCRFFGLYRTTVGVDQQGKDFFENVVFEAPEPAETTTVQTEPPTEDTTPETDAITEAATQAADTLDALVTDVETLSLDDIAKEGDNTAKYIAVGCGVAVFLLLVAVEVSVIINKNKKQS